ncbi:glucose-6-phosphate dehydrogenase assembly protein OpcA [Microbacterium sp. EYE_5]|uniref:glucose-6-phosphate dehydrogenase assembly protein OpcA n=1 Tax=unclassified Microbacterium TaxID=2609290 RepID=UPI002004C6B4|nr:MULTISPECIES: glucose-6-phosphate dehydrogenase assembly protein OpcA [unclassified Microbacterium]MCK6080500.1 glucose-6-phosphate dehydrogenase assembly protein OpcA [Microbacterium sp. EYE_382]MCK6085771.1 glucose-6-phosphate dehydrogenase assembly protein OpcA [Microbacterium sp. EYE_384]MCK6124731.1 glucose-6-phosphate dehydrogenase assembly protein OpcA [Microbacterium sp. EYE_80]MCK6127640.1 glucose-6-phosphate dehydrogenase assembly protein OpcA [Microbacterium sp. EYE_79]MCK6141455
MIVDLPDTTVSTIAKKLVSVREEGGAVALGRVLTLVIVSTGGFDEEAIEAANAASREHPMRVIVLVVEPDGPTGLDAQIRVGGDAGASEVVVLRARGEAAGNQESLVNGLLLPDAPVVAWWPDDPPADPAQSPIGRMAQRRITDASTKPVAHDRLSQLGSVYAPGDTDLAWTRLTHWREQLAAVLDQPPFEEVAAVRVVGAGSSPSTGLLAAWLRMKLDVAVDWHYASAEEWAHGIRSVTLSRPSGDIVLERSNETDATLTQPGQPTHDIVLPRRSLRECLAEELRRLDPDLLYGRVITEGWELLDPPTR